MDTIWTKTESHKDAECRVLVFLTNGVKLDGKIVETYPDGLTLEREGVSQSVMKHAIATIMPIKG